MPQIYDIAGPNAAGKTTFAISLLPDLLQCQEYVNVEVIAAGLSPFAPEASAFKQVMNNERPETFKKLI